ncbi:MAG TPA: ComF family protein [Candidatus Paceibacterota bacterium]|nr:ComF family protein [Candidatus Paceibacterota bacterium]
MRIPLGAQAVHAGNAILDLVFPPSARERRVRRNARRPLPAAPAATDDAIIALSLYRDSSIADAIQALKYEKSRAAARQLAGLLADFLLELMGEEDAFDARALVLVPMPLAKRRFRERGYNQIALSLAELPALGIALPVRADLLARTRETTPQTLLSRHARLTNVKGAFAAPLPRAAYQGVHAILIDDVTTTGATLTEAARTLRTQGAAVTALALARA